MRRNLLFISIILFIFAWCNRAKAQSNQTVANGGSTTAVNFAGSTRTSPLIIGNIFASAIRCSLPSSFKITVMPTSTPLTITASAPAGSITACEGTASASPYIAQSTIKAGSLSGDVTATAPANFEISLSANSGYSNSLTLTQTNGAINNTVIYIRSSATAPAGNILGDVALTLAGVNIQNIPVKGLINALPTISAGFNQAIVSGTSTSAINFTGTGNMYNWANDMPGIGLAASGTGNIPSFIAVNNTGNPVTATITATPEYVGYAYISNENENTVSVINTTTHAIDYTIAVGIGPTGVAVSPDYSHVYVANQKDNTISVISTLTNTVTATFNVNSFSPTGITVSPDGSKLYVVELNSNLVSVINATNGTVITTINVGGYPIGVAISPDGTRLYVANSSSSVSVIDVANSTVIKTITVAKGPYGITVSPDGSKVYLTNYDANVITIIAAANNTIVTTIPVGSDPTGIAISPDGSRVYVTNQNDKTVSVINTATNEVVITIPVGSNPFGVSVSPDGSQAYVANNTANNVSIINTATNTLITTVPVSFGPVAFGNFITAGTGCSGLPATYTINVDPVGTVLAPNIRASGSLQPLVTTYGAPSPTTQFTITGSNMTGGILVTPPPGFEVSTNGVNFSNTASFGSAGNSISEIFVRLAATTPVGNYAGNIVLTAAGAANVNVPTVLSLVNRAPLTIFADNKTKVYGSDNPALTVTYSGFVNGENEAVLTTLPVISTDATAASAPGTYTISVSGSSAANYNITYINGVLTITRGVTAKLFIPNTFTPNGDGINDTWDIKNIENYPNCKVDIYNRWGERLYSSIGYPIPWDGKYKGTYLPSGTYYYIINTELNRNVIAGWVAIIK